MTSVQVTIDAIAAGGAGVGRAPDGRALFVHRTAPGELVTARITEKKPRFARGQLIRVDEPSAHRRTAPCSYYDRCGGCTLEHLQYDAQLAVKARIVADAVARIGGMTINVPEVVPSPFELRYRNRVSFTLVRLGDGQVRAGFHEIHRPDRVLDIDESCLMPEAAVAEAWQRLRAAWGRNASRLPSGQRLRLTLRATAAGDAALLVQGGFGPGRPDELLPRVPMLRAIWHQPRPGDEPVLLAGSDRLGERWQDEDIELGGAVFLQVNREAAVLLENHVLEVAGDVENRVVVDAYCGVGLHTRRLSARGARVTGIELDSRAIGEAERGAPGAHFITDTVEAALPSVLPVDLVVVNPPRAGLDAAVVAALVAQPPDRIIYISCDPATLARDLKRLAPAFALRSIRCFDLFPQTAHVETVVELTCSTM